MRMKILFLATNKNGTNARKWHPMFDGKFLKIFYYFITNLKSYIYSLRVKNVLYSKSGTIILILSMFYLRMMLQNGYGCVVQREKIFM